MIKPEVLDALVAAGCTAEQIAAAVKADQARSSGAERQARYRARKASQSDERNVTSVTVTDKKDGFPQTPSEEKNIPPISPQTAIDAEFNETFWPAYPLKRSRGQALKAFRTARKRASLAAIMAGVHRYAAERQGQDQKYTKYAQGWLNGESWDDEPDRQTASVTPIKRDEDRAPEEMERHWRGRLDLCRHSAQDWLTHAWGPMPGKPGCRVPPELLKPGDGEGWSEWKSSEAA